MTRDSVGRKGIVVGGAGGIGRAVVAAARSAGDQVLVLDMIAEDQEMILCDQSSPQSVEDAFHEVDQRFGGCAPDWIVAAASISRRHSILEAEPSTIEELLKVNIFGTALICQAAGRRMREAQHGNIVVITSIAAMQAWAQEAFYGVTKAAQTALVQALAVELGAYGIFVNGVGPGPVDVTSKNMVATRNEGGATKALLERTPAQRFARAEEIAEAVMFLTRSSWVNGQILYVDGGFLATGMALSASDLSR